MGNSNQGSENRNKPCIRRRWTLKESGTLQLIRGLWKWTLPDNKIALLLFMWIGKALRIIMEHALVCGFVFFFFFLKNMHHSWRNTFWETSLNINSSDFFLREKKKKSWETRNHAVNSNWPVCLTFNSESMMN